ncbi:aspartate/glutamate racemase family protein [Propionimicrobium sp. PCR01-08-3]|uniref:aspartate/glutamate racemase family protein n=1 Tax=Propionimicrobium sp. PCR01-08-3 TaxID=3052086 RepID=UPI00255C7B1D|nr:aspartate/glutamate racemase family protein [Propionimicrobium sp. PCR01-08-3]WIY82525.1 aspartate/glutamate racemase family protein [Propionimicrobium sp. PCR01-08-3]
MRILVLNPNSSAATTRALARVAENWARVAGHQVVTEYLPEAPELLITQADNDRVAGEILRRGDRLGVEGFDAMVVACHGDPGLPAGWLITPDGCPVVGMGWASITEAAGSSRCTAVSDLRPGSSDSRVPDKDSHASYQTSICGPGAATEQQLWGVLCVSADIADDKLQQVVGYGLTIDKAVVRGAVRRDYESGSTVALESLLGEVNQFADLGVRVVLLGCGAMSGLADQVRARTGIEVIEPLTSALDRVVLLGRAA